MKKIISVFLIALLSMQANATLLSVEIDPAGTDFQIGDSLTAKIIVSDIDETFGFQTLIAAFNINVNYDNTQLMVNNINFGDKLSNDPFWQSHLLSPSQIYLDELAYFFDLFSTQNGLTSFELATVTFDVIGQGAGSISLSDFNLFDDIGFELENIASQSASYTIVSNTQVPVPATLALFVLAFGLAIRKVKI